MLHFLFRYQFVVATSKTSADTTDGQIAGNNGAYWEIFGHFYLRFCYTKTPRGVTKDDHVHFRTIRDKSSSLGLFCIQQNDDKINKNKKYICTSQQAGNAERKLRESKKQLKLLTLQNFT